MTSSATDYTNGYNILQDQNDDSLTTHEKIDRKYEALGGFSWTQLIAILALGVGGDSALWIISNLGYFTQQPAYQCLVDGNIWISGGICTVQNICDEDPQIKEYRIDYSDSKTLDNWWFKLDLQCKEKWEYQSIASMYFLGYCCTLLWVPLLSDKYSRKWLYIPG